MMGSANWFRLDRAGNRSRPSGATFIFVNNDNKGVSKMTGIRRCCREKRKTCQLKPDHGSLAEKPAQSKRGVRTAT
jgi:hypothetical protein